MQTSLRWTSDWAISPDGSPAIIGSIRLAISQRAISQGSKPNTESCKSAVRVEALCCSSQGEYGTGKAGAPKKSLSYRPAIRRWPRELFPIVPKNGRGAGQGRVGKYVLISGCDVR